MSKSNEIEYTFIKKDVQVTETEVSFCVNDYKKYFKKTRKPEIAWNRFLIFKFLNENGITLKEVGDICGGYNHATVINGIKTANSFMSIKEKKFMRITLTVGQELFPEIYSVKSNSNLSDSIRENLHKIGIDAKDNFAICGQFGERTFTVGGFIDFMEGILNKES